MMWTRTVGHSFARQFATQHVASTWSKYGRPPLCKIVATIGPASEDAETLPKCVHAGMHVMRINYSHATLEESELRLKNIPLAKSPENLTAGSPPNLRAVLLDTRGPEMRLGGLKVCQGWENRKAKVDMKAGAEITLSIDPALDGIGDESQMFVNYERMPAIVQPGARILIDDGLVELEVLEIVQNNSAVRCRIMNSNPLGERKSVCMPGIPIDLPAMSEKDMKDIRYGVERNMDFVAASFIRKAADVHDIRRFIAGCQVELGLSEQLPPLILSKIETLEGLNNFDEILDASDGIMVARGDLGVEIPLTEVTLAQKMMICKCNAVGKPVIVATQMLDSMSKNPRPTRAEVSDVTNAVHDGADAVMLSGESANGNFPVEAIATMREIIHKTETSQLYPLPCSIRTAATPQVIEHDETNAIAAGIASMAHAAQVQAIAVDDPGRGDLVRKISKYRPNVPVMALVGDPKLGRQLILHYGVHPVVATDLSALPFGSKRMTGVKELARSLGYASKGGRVLTVGPSLDGGFMSTCITEE